MGHAAAEPDHKQTFPPGVGRILPGSPSATIVESENFSRGLARRSDPVCHFAPPRSRWRRRRPSCRARCPAGSPAWCATTSAGAFQRADLRVRHHARRRPERRQRIFRPAAAVGRHVRATREGYLSSYREEVIVRTSAALERTIVLTRMSACRRRGWCSSRGRRDRLRRRVAGRRARGQDRRSVAERDSGASSICPGPRCATSATGAARPRPDGDVLDVPAVVPRPDHLGRPAHGRGRVSGRRESELVSRLPDDERVDSAARPSGIVPHSATFLAVPARGEELRRLDSFADRCPPARCPLGRAGRVPRPRAAVTPSGWASTAAGSR